MYIGPPGPRINLGLPISKRVGGLVTTFRNLLEAWPDDVYEADIVQSSLLGRPITYVIKPEYLHTLLKDEAHKLARDDAMSRALEPALGAGLLTSDGQVWQAQRRIVAPAFRPERVRTFIPTMVEAAERTLQRWQVGSGESVVDLQTEMMRTSFDAIIGMIVSDDGGIDSRAFGAAMDTYLGQTNWKMALGIAGAPGWLPHPGSLAGKRAARTLRSMVSEVIQQRRRRGEVGDDLLGTMMKAFDPETGNTFDDRWLIDNLLTFVMAGHETTALVMAWALRLVADHPEIRQRILDEVASTSANFTDPLAVDQLGYTKQVIFETMRLFPPAALLVRRTTDAIQLGDIDIAAGQSIHIPVYALHRQRRFWDDPDKFDPDRFAQERQQARHRFTFLPFGAGRRVCVGMGMAITECLVVLATLLPRIDFMPLQPVLPRTHLRVTLRPVGGLPIHIKHRAND
ncbi:MAG: cytochrome P450 [Janthinobacterium lividum]